ncbi:MAG: sigma-54 dependent transcriptional regulator [Bdellovibrionota bacterium]
MSSNPRVLIADDEKELRDGLRGPLARRGFDVDEAQDGDSAFRLCVENNYDLVLLDVRMPLKSGLEALAQIKSHNSKSFIVLVTAHANVKDAVQAMQMGAFDYIEKPLKMERLDEIIDEALHARELGEKVTLSSPKESSSTDFVGGSKPMQRVFELIDRLAKVTTSVLIRGENGTGKELVARAIHAHSARRSKPFVAVNCGAIPEALVESELFGHEKGAFTGADQRKIGRFQFASGGTLFLDEVAELPTAVQVKLLRVLQERKVNPVGSNREFPVDVRIIAATNRNIEKMMTEGRFRNDLFYRLNVMPVFLPPLRERVDDIPALVAHFIKTFNEKHARSITSLAPETAKQLMTYSWPGNIRELENSVEHAFVLTDSDQIKIEDFPDHIREALLDKEEGWNLPFDESEAPKPQGLDFRAAKEDFEKDFIARALKQNKGRINQTCDRAGIPKNTLLRKMQKYGIQASDFGSDNS